jgi:hypothetical protein
MEPAMLSLHFCIIVVSEIAAPRCCANQVDISASQLFKNLLSRVQTSFLSPEAGSYLEVQILPYSADV